MAYDLADVIPLTVEIKDSNGNLANATTVVLTVGLPDGSTAHPAVLNPSVGTYQCDYVPTAPGRHTVTWVATGANASGYSDTFEVLPSAPANIISLQDAKDQLNITGVSQDEELRDYIGAVTGVVERHVNQAVVRRTFTEEHTVSIGSMIPLSGQVTPSGMVTSRAQNYAGTAALVVNWAPVVSLISVALVDGTYSWDVSTLHVSPAGVVTSPLGNPPRGNLAITYIAGMAVVPPEYGLAARIILQHLWETQRGSGGGPRPGGLADSMQLGLGHMGFAIPNRAVELLGGGIPGFA